jgi:hypothetical protein
VKAAAELQAAPEDSKVSTNGTTTAEALAAQTTANTELATSLIMALLL